MNVVAAKFLLLHIWSAFPTLTRFSAKLLVGAGPTAYKKQQFE